MIAVGGLWCTATLARQRILADADLRVARIAAGYLGVVTSAARADRASPETRLLSAAGSLAGARFWQGGLQVWLHGTPLLTADTTGRAAALATFDVGTEPGAGVAGVWETVGPGAGAPLVAVGGGFAVAALLVLGAAGGAMPVGRPRALVAMLGLLVVGAGVLGQGVGAYRTWRDAQDAGLLRARRVLEITALGRRLREGEVAAIAADLVVTPVPHRGAVRDSAVMRDTVGARLTAVAARGQAWEIAAPMGVERYASYWRALVAWGGLALVAGFVSAALTPGRRYLSASRPDPPTSP